MKLTRLEIKNYRSLFVDDKTGEHVVLDLADGVNTIVGPNNCGKSNVFRALAVALDPDFPVQRTKDMPASMRFSKPTMTLTFSVPRRGRSSMERTLLKYLDEYEREANPRVGSTFASEDTVKLRVTIEGSDETDGTRRRSFVASGAGGRTLASDHELTVKALAQFDKCLHFVMVRSGESLESLLEGKFREILHSALGDVLKTQLEQANASREKFIEDLQRELLAPLNERVNEDLQDLFPEINSVQLRPDVQSLAEVLAHMRVDVTDIAPTDLADKGTGVRGGVIVALLRHLATTGRRSMLFAVEEPEAFLHPAGQEKLREDLEALVKRPDVSLLVTSHSPYIVSREANAKVFALAKDDAHRTVLVDQSRGDETQAGVLGGLFRDRLVADVLDRAAKVPSEAAAVVVVEGWTDEQYFRAAADVVGRPELVADLAFVTAGTGVLGHNAGGAHLAVMQALIMQSTSPRPVAVVFDNDEPGKKAFNYLVEIGTKTQCWKKNVNVLSYRSVFSDGSFPWEAEDLWRPQLVEAFVADNGGFDAGADRVFRETRERPDKELHIDLKAQHKAAFVEHVREHAVAEDADCWIKLLETIRNNLELPAATTAGGDRGSIATPAEAVEEVEAQRTDSAKRGLAVWPLPGGVTNWKATLDAMIDFLAQGEVTAPEAARWLAAEYQVRSDRAASHHWLVPITFGLAKRTNAGLELTGEGRQYQDDPSPRRLGRALVKHAAGCREILEWLADGSASVVDLLDLFNAAGYTWATDVQVQRRLQWLAIAEAVKRLDDGSWRRRS